MRKSVRTPRQILLQELLRSLRCDAGLQQSDLARRLGKPQSFVSKYENGERRLDLAELQDVCDAIGVPLNRVVTEFERRARLRPSVF